MRRKIMTVLLTAALVLGLVGCIDKGNKDNDDVGQTPPIVEVPEEKPEEKPEDKEEYLTSLKYTEGQRYIELVFTETDRVVGQKFNIVLDELIGEAKALKIKPTSVNEENTNRANLSIVSLKINGEDVLPIENEFPVGSWQDNKAFFYKGLYAHSFQKRNDGALWIRANHEKNDKHTEDGHIIIDLEGVKNIEIEMTTGSWIPLTDIKLAVEMGYEA